ncbi:hypothetical protein ACOMHN_041904 [Nucella lapillus]
MAMLLPRYRRRSRLNLTCGVCKDVYRSPRLLPCHHSFCLDCVEGLIGVKPRVFSCPECRRPTPVPRNGALGFPRNFYIAEEDLEEERGQPQVATCSSHDEEPLTLFCVPCDQSICLFCKLTKHDHHETLDLSEAAERCRDQLEASEDRLDATIDYLSKVLVNVHDSREAVKLKEHTLLEEVQARRDDIVTTMDKWCEELKKDVKELTSSVDTQLTQETQAIQQSHDSLLQLRQQLNHALGVGSEAETVHMEKEMRQGKGSEEELSKLKEGIPTSTSRPGVRYGRSLITDHTIRHWLGSVVCFSIPLNVVMSEDISSVYQCGQDRLRREVHTISYLDENTIYISFGGSGPDYTDEQVTCIDKEGLQDGLWPSTEGKVCFFKRSKTTFKCSASKGAEGSMVLLSPGSQYMLVKHAGNSKHCAVARYKAASPLRRENIFNASCENPTAFRTSLFGQLFAIIEEETSKQPSKTQLNVRLFNWGQNQPFATYTPSVSHFHPADVCFWWEEGQRKLLVADANNDSVHVVRIEDSSCCFERYLAAGNGNIVCPTALCTDDLGNVWIGCRNGRILECKRLNEQADVSDEDSPEESVSGSPLIVDNASQLTETVSQLSTE